MESFLIAWEMMGNDLALGFDQSWLTVTVAAQDRPLLGPAGAANQHESGSIVGGRCMGCYSWARGEPWENQGKTIENQFRLHHPIARVL